MNKFREWEWEWPTRRD